MFDMFLYLILFLVVAIMIGVLLIMFNNVNDVFDEDVDVGQVNLAEVNNQTFGRMNTAFINSADYIGVFLLFGMVLAMILNAYFLGSRYPKVFFVVDIFILLFAFILAVYVSRVYDTLIHSADIFSVFRDDLPKTSKFLLNLPVITTIVGIIIMIISYSSIKRDDKGAVNVYGYD